MLVREIFMVERKVYAGEGGFMVVRESFMLVG
jgi:hypothetical protein